MAPHDSRSWMESGVPFHGAPSSVANEGDRVAALQSDASVLITSEHQDERRDWARSIHAAGSRRTGPFVAIDCGVSEVIRARHYPPTGRDDLADDIRHRFCAAAAGTLFVDRVDMMSGCVQAILMSLLDETVRHPDRTAPHRRSHPRLITGASRSLLEAVSAGTFNAALFYRLNVIHIECSSYLRGGLMKVKDVMSVPPHPCRADADLAAVARVMWDHDCGFVPLIDASGRVAGVITDRDICMAVATRDLSPERIAAAETISGPVHICQPDDSVSDALEMMKAFKVRRLPVVDAYGQLHGVISMNDIVLVSDQKRKPTPGLVVSALAAICAHRSAETVATAAV